MTFGALQDPVTYAIPAFVVFLVLELLSFRFLDDDDDRFRGYHGADARASLLMGAGSVVVNSVLRVGALVFYAWLWELTPLRVDMHSWWGWAVVIVGVDFVFYWTHRASHRIRFFWAAHQAHHNSQYFNYATALRQKWNPWADLLFWIPIPLLGVPPWALFTAFSINLIYQFWVHTERVGKLWAPIEYVLNTPSHHRVHHASDPDYLDKNYAGILMIWDRMFGSYVDETHRPTYGLTKNVESFNVFTLQYHEYGALVRDVRRARSWRARLGYLFGPPGWTPAGSVAGSVEGEVVPAAPVQDGLPRAVA